MKKRFIAILILSLLLVAALAGCSINVSKKQISTGTDTKVKTIMLTDIRFDGSAADEIREQLIRDLVSGEKAEFLAISGNIVNCNNNGQVMKKAVKFIDSLGIPWATSIGELDVKGNTSKNQIMRILTHKSLKNSMVMRGESYKYNYMLEVTSSKGTMVNLFYFVDTSVDCSNEFVDWYKNSIELTSLKHMSVQGQLIKSQVFMNRPLPIYAENTSVMETMNFTVTPWGNSDIFQRAIIDLGSTRSVMAGYDELTDGTRYRPKDVQYTYVQSLSFDSSMSGELYAKQKDRVGCSYYEFQNEERVSISTKKISPEKYRV